MPSTRAPKSNPTEPGQAVLRRELWRRLFGQSGIVDDGQLDEKRCSLFRTGLKSNLSPVLLHDGVCNLKSRRQLLPPSAGHLVVNGHKSIPACAPGVNPK